MASSLRNSVFRVVVSRYAYSSRLTKECSSRQLSISYTLRNDTTDGNENSTTTKQTTNKSESGLKKENALKKLQELLNKTRSTRKTEENDETVTLKKDSSKTPKLSKPRLKKFKDKSETDDVGGLDPEIVYAAHRVAASTTSMSDGKESDPIKNEDKKQIRARKIESDLLRRLKATHKETEDVKESGDISSFNSLSKLISSIEVEQEKTEPEALERRAPDARGQEVRKAVAKKQLTQEQMSFLEKRRRLREAQQSKEEEESYVPIDLFGSQPPLGIFTNTQLDQPGIELKMWKKCQEREMKILSTPAPRNFLEEMAVKTERGILWNFPIDNEQGIDETKMEPFHAHVFLEHHLEPWCPRKGPIRHFMELVCVGLSKNPYISADKKLDHINWYKDYFENPDHSEILRLSGAMD